MPGFVGNINIVSIGGSSIVQIGDALLVNPQSTSKSYAGSGSFNTGVEPQTFNALNSTNTLDNDLNDSNNV